MAQLREQMTQWPGTVACEWAAGDGLIGILQQWLQGGCNPDARGLRCGRWAKACLLLLLGQTRSGAQRSCDCASTDARGTRVHARPSGMLRSCNVNGLCPARIALLRWFREHSCPWDDDTRARAAELGYTDDIRNSNLGDPHRWTDGGVRGVDSAQTATGPPSTLTKLGLAPSTERVAESSRMSL